tara:strand:+ start:221 stop:1558 length:1338 start_codon:yes stop_codon:yes gene_type:complete
MPQMKSFFDLVNELSMKSDKKLPNLKVPVKGKKGVSKFSRKKAIGQAKDDLNAGFKTDANRKAAFAKMNDAVQSADKKPEKYMKPDGKVGVRMVKTDKEVIKKEQMQVFRIGHKTMGGNVHAKDPQSAMAQLRKKGVKGDIKLTHRGSVKSMPKAKKVEQTEASVLKPTKPTDIIKHAKTLAKNPRDYMMNKKKYLDKARAKVFRMYPKEAINHDDAHRDAQTHSDGSMSVKKIPSMIKKPGDKHLHLHMKSYHKEKDGQDFAKKHGYKVKNYVKTPSGTRMDIHKEMVDPMDLRGRPKKPDPNPESPYGIKHPLHPANIAKKKAKEAEKAKKEEVDVDEALNLAQRMKRSRLMKRMKARIKIGRKRAMKKMANKKTIEKRAMRQARNQIAKKLTRGIPKKELTFARKQEIEKRLAKPALQQRIKRIAKRIFKDVRKAEVQRKKG